MSDPFLDAESSVQDGSTRELLLISVNDGVTFYRHTPGTQDIVYLGQTYTAIAMMRSEIVPFVAGRDADLEVTLPIDHPLVRRWTRNAAPPSKVTVTLYHQAGGVTETVWQGEAEALACEDATAVLRVPSRAGEWMLRPLPHTISRLCPHVLYDGNCGVLRTGSSPGGLAYQVSTTVIAVDGDIVRVDLGSTDRNGTWAELGELKHASSGENRAIALQTDIDPGVSSIADLRLNQLIPEMKVGDSVTIWRGCDRTIGTCNSAFGNEVNHGGLPHLPDRNPHLPSGFGPEELI